LETAHVMAKGFALGRRVFSLEPFGNGNVNDTFLVTCRDGSPRRFLLQRINPRVFPFPRQIAGNMRTVTEHVLERLQRDPFCSSLRWEVPRLLLTREGLEYEVDWKGHVWRAMTFIEEAETFQTVQGEKHAREVGRALGIFHCLIHDMPMDKVVRVLENFHVAPHYLQRYDRILSHGFPAKSPETEHVRKFVDERRGVVSHLEDAKAQERLEVVPIHGDPKVNNILFDRLSHTAVAMVDLDTVTPGLLLYDLGDCLRSCCNLLGEETREWERVRFDMDLCRAILGGYMASSQKGLKEGDRDHLFEAIRLLPLELGLRFFTDYLEGNVYFKVAFPEQNLLRALVQFRLTESIEEQSVSLRILIGDLFFGRKHGPT